MASLLSRARIGPAVRRSLARATRPLLALWGLLLLLVVTSLAAAHSYTLPRPATRDPFLEQALSAYRLPSERGFFALHVLYTSCRCSTRILTDLASRSPLSGVHESVLLVGKAHGHDARLSARGYRVNVVSPAQLLARFRLQSAPLLIVAGPDQQLRYLGGYTDRKQGAQVKDQELLQQVLHGESPLELPLFGCAVSRSLQRMIDPFQLQTYARDEDTP